MKETWISLVYILLLFIHLYRAAHPWVLHYIETPRISRRPAHEGGKFVSPTNRPPLQPRKYSWYSFLLEAESTPGQQCGRKDYVNEKFQWHHREYTEKGGICWERLYWSVEKCNSAMNKKDLLQIELYWRKEERSTVLCLLGNIPASELLVPSFRNLLAVPSSQALSVEVTPRRKYFEFSLVSTSQFNTKRHIKITVCLF